MKSGDVEQLHAVQMGHEKEYEEEGKKAAGATEKGEHEPNSSIHGARTSFFT